MVSRRTNKARGSNAERDLIHKFWKHGWAAMRAAGSGSSQFPSPDILASNNIRKVALEVKLTIEKKKYLTKKEIKELLYFSEKFGAEPWIAVKFPRTEWLFLHPEDLEETNASFVVDSLSAERKALSFEEFISM